jgi:tetrathionate reductase subunit B
MSGKTFFAFAVFSNNKAKKIMSKDESKSSHHSVDRTKRRFFAQAAAGAAGLVSTIISPGVILFSPRPAEARNGKTSKVRWGFLIDSTKCEDNCTLCVTACRKENGWQGSRRQETLPQWIRIAKIRDPQNGATLSLPVMCQHCEFPPCVDVCPTNASTKRADGIVLVDKGACIGCRYCMLACPYKARSFVYENVEKPKAYAPRAKGAVEACTLCAHRIDEGGIPACVEACASKSADAIIFGDLNDPESAISRDLKHRFATRIRADMGTAPNVFYRGL